MSQTTLPPQTDVVVTRAHGAGDVKSDEGLRRALNAIEEADSWNCPPGDSLLAEIRRRAVRNAARVASATNTTTNRVSIQPNNLDDIP